MLPTYTWDEAQSLRLFTAQGFEAFGVKASTIRKWASRDQIRALGKGPRNASLYALDDVLALAEGPRDVGTYTMIVFRRGHRHEDEILSDPQLLDLWRQHVYDAGALPLPGPRMTLVAGPQPKHLRAVEPGIVDSATVAVRITGRGSRRHADHL